MIPLKPLAALLRSNVVLALGEPTNYLRKLTQKLNLRPSLNAKLLNWGGGKLARDVDSMIRLGDYERSLECIDDVRGLQRVVAPRIRAFINGQRCNLRAEIVTGISSRGVFLCDLSIRWVRLLGVGSVF